MLEILALVYLCGKIGSLAEQKGQKKGWWKFYTILAWFGAEFLGAILSVLIFRADDIFSMMPLAYAFAIGSYFILKAVLSKKPDVENSFEFENTAQS
jgi:hypothetical protein